MTDITMNRSGKPLFVRPGEKVGGGFWVFRRGSYGGRIKPGPIPYEHPNFESALIEMCRLKEKYPDQQFIIVGEMSESD